MKVILIGIQLLIVHVLFAQTALIDSLNNVIKTSANDTDIVKAYNHLAIVISKNNPDSAISMLNTGIEIAQTKGFKKLEAVLLTNKGFEINKKGRDEQSAKLLLEAIELYKELELQDRISHAYFTLGTFKANNQEFNKAKVYLEKAYETAKDLKDQDKLLGMICNNLGLIYGYLEQRAKSVSFKVKAIKYKEKTNDPYLASSIMNLSLDYFNYEDYTSAITQLKKAYSLLEKDSTNQKAICLQMLAQNYLAIKDLDKNRLYLDKLAEHANFLNDSSFLAITQLENGSFLFASKKYEQANKAYDKALRLLPKNGSIRTNAQININYAISLSELIQINNELDKALVERAISKAEKAFELSIETGALKDQLLALELLKVITELSGDLSSSLQYASEYIKLNDSIYNKEKNLAAADLRFKYETEKKELEIDLLNSENQLKENQLKENAQKAKQQRIIITISLFGLLLTAIIGFLLLRQSKQRKKVNAKLQVQNDTISNQYEEKELLLKEIHHRVKNNLQVISSLLELQAKKVSDAESEVFKEGQSRVRAMALIHEELYQNNDLAEVDFKAYSAKLSRQIQSLFPGKEKVTISIEGPMIKLDIDTAIPLGLILNELVTNSFKYGLDEKGQLSIVFKEIAKGNYSVSVSDNGQGLAEDFDYKKSKSLGLRLVHRLTKQLYGKVEYSYNENSTFEISFKDTIERKKVA